MTQVAEVAELEERVVAAGRSVRAALEDATDAWARLDAERGAAIDARRSEWSAATRAVDDRAYELIATRRPTASDLRRLVSLIRVAEEVDRSGELVAHVARAAGFERDPGAYGDVIPAAVAWMARIAGRLWDDALDAYENGDPTAARLVDAADDELDAAHRQLLDSLLSGALTTRSAIDVALIGRFLERLGDHAVDIAARADFVATGTPPRAT